MDVIGMLPVVGEAADVANAVIYAARGDWGNAALSALSVIPLADGLVKSMKMGKTAGKAVQTMKRTIKRAAEAYQQTSKGAKRLKTAVVASGSEKKATAQANKGIEAAKRGGELRTPVKQPAVSATQLGKQSGNQTNQIRNAAQAKQSSKAAPGKKANQKAQTEVTRAGRVDSGSGREAQTITNKFPSSKQSGRTINFTVENGKINIENGIQEVDFIIDMDGNLQIGRRHSYLANGNSVQAAGTMKVNSQGYVRLITNESGHYRPTVAQAMNYPDIFRSVGLNVDNAWIKMSNFKTSMSNYIIDEDIFYNGPIQYMPK